MPGRVWASEKQFKHSTSRSHHIRKSHRERCLSCQACGKTFLTKSRLVAHQRVRTSECYKKEVQTCIFCIYCHKQFKATQNPIYRQIKAYYFETEGKNNDALDIYNEIISTDSSASLLYKRAKLEFHTLEFEKAIADLKEALELVVQQELPSDERAKEDAAR